MKAIVIEKFGGPESLVIKDVPTPEPKQGEVVMQIKAFGINHAEIHMRKGEWAEWMPISGIECVGTVSSCPGGEFREGTPVASLMGGLGRTIDGNSTVVDSLKMVRRGGRVCLAGFLGGLAPIPDFNPASADGEWCPL
ncbi:hypothetical protein N7455_011012 [Penicillium solitum]|uniref:Alcohol dehydrogenase-like N-terminal domain-containing protein n=1 Tax=Penicillium solitum TaxID=60172 RepID=A0A1V6QRY9_9EURO|nr:uncharacterized protein PENSOL_c046G03455 [Penicillium solitum]KAF4763709.1 hypothetical protein HAV15_000780 [Penicillium sp. str. \